MFVFLRGEVTFDKESTDVAAKGEDVTLVLSFVGCCLTGEDAGVDSDDGNGGTGGGAKDTIGA